LLTIEAADIEASFKEIVAFGAGVVATTVTDPDEN
jgi:hypothetical protein